MAKDTSQQGLISQTAILNRLVQLGFEVVLPWADHLGYDMAYYIVEEHRNSAGGLKAKEVAPKAATLNRFDTMTVGATHFAFGYFGFDARPSTALREQVRYLICFVTMYVVEFKNTD